jgi:ribonuclease J
MEVTVYDGATTIGGNKIYVEENGRGVFLDFGMNFARYNRYFAEFLSERSVRGVHDLLYLNLIPKLNIYRKDVIPSDVDVSSYPKLNVEAVLLSHAHVDHCGNIGLLKENISLVASAMSLAIIKAMRDSSKSSLGSEVAYFSPRFCIDEEGKILKSKNTGEYIGRHLVCVGELNDRLNNFLCSVPLQNEPKVRKKLSPGEICCVEERELPFDVKAFEVDHSIYGAMAYILYGDSAIAYTGDIRFHGKNAEKSGGFVREAKNASVLIVEGTRVIRKEDYNESEEIVYENCLEAAEDENKLIIADFSPRNFERLEMFKDIAERTGRCLVVTAKDAYMLDAIRLVDGVERLQNVLIYKELKDVRERWEKKIRNEMVESLIDPSEISRNPEQYILCFSFYDMKHLLDIKPKGGSYIYSSSEAYTEEQEFDFLRLNNWLREFELKVYGFEIDEDEKPRFVKGYHASGHASKEDLKRMITKIDPDLIIPVHTENPKWFAENFENVKIVKEGESVEI